MDATAFGQADIKVLLVDDSPEQRQFVGLQLAELRSPRFHLREAFRLADGLSILSNERIDVALLDLTLPDARGLEAVTTVRNRFPSVPVVVLTGTDDERLAMKALREGADDYLVKDGVTAQVLKRVLLHAMERHRVAEALASSRERLLEAQKLEALGRLAGGIAHDFNNVLVSIIGYSDILMEELADSELCEDAREIKLAGERATQLTRQILAFSRRDQPTVEALDVNEVVDPMRRMLARLLPRKICLDIKLEPSLPRILADRGHLEQVVMNLVVNARDAISERGEICVKTDIVQMEPDGRHFDTVPSAGNYVVLRVGDNGSGMPEHVIRRIFEPFFTTKSKEAGTGLGLSTVYGIVKSAGGGIAVDSAPGLGTQFHVYFPISEREGTCAEETVYEMLSSPSGEKILVLEDKEPLRKLVERVLKRAGYEVVSAVNEADAEALYDHSVDLLLLAKTFRGQDGEKLASGLLEETPGGRVLVLTSHAADPVVALTAFPSITKPFTPARLLTRVLEVLKAPAPTFEVVTSEKGFASPGKLPTVGAPTLQQAPPEVNSRRESQDVQDRIDHLNHIISHDLQEPVRMINSYLGLLARRSGPDLDSGSTEFLEFARDGGARLEKMLHGILKISRLNRDAPREVTADTRAIFERVKEKFAKYPGTLEWKGAFATLPMSGEHLETALIELVDNGFKFQADNPKEARVTVAVELTDDCFVVSVEDNGVGFPSGDLAPCLELFGRMHARDEYDGVGLGLALCGEIARVYSGSVVLTRLKEGGSSVGLIIPRKETIDN
ncbi:MAG: ATP-binding protein [Vulcanimicrobiota bacterium]